MVKTWNVNEIVKQHVPSNLWHVLEQDETVQEYLLQLLGNQDDDDNDDDDESLIETLSAVFQGYNTEDNISEHEIQVAAQSIVQAIRTQQKQEDSEDKRKTKQTETNENVQQPIIAQGMCLGNPSLLPNQTTSAAAAAAAAAKDDDDHPPAQRLQDEEEHDDNDEPSLLQEENKVSSTHKTNRASLRKEKREKRQRQKKNQQQHGGTSTTTTTTTTKQQHHHDNDNNDNVLLLEDSASAWQECKDGNIIWGGRGKGGRGTYTISNSVKSNIHLHSVSITMENGNELLTDSVMDIQRGHRYGLIGRNGVGKSTLLRRLASCAIPGLPHHDLRMVLVQQQVEGSDTQTTLQSLIEADIDRTELLQEQTRIEQEMDKDDDDDNNNNRNNEERLAQLAERLGNIAMELDAIDADGAEDRALEILKGLQFTTTMIHSPTSTLSGGWRMRLALAKALMVQHVDILCLDEATNHLDLVGLNWLIQYLTTGKISNKSPENTKLVQERTLMLVSHDRSFLDAVCTDIVVMEHKRLSYHVGNYSEYIRQQEEKSARESQILDAAERQRTKALAFVQKQQQQSAKSADPNKQRQAKMIKEKKLERIGNYREDGKRYKLRSLKKLDESSVRLAQKVQIEVDNPIIQMYFPNPTWPPGLSSSTEAAAAATIVRMEDFKFSYNSIDNNKEEDVPYLLKNITLQLNRGSKVALVGKNGAGKSTLVKLISGELLPSLASMPAAGSENKNNNISQPIVRGELWRHPNIRVGHVTQYSVEELEKDYADKTVLEYAELQGLHNNARASASIVAKAGGNIRQYLGAFGLGGSQHALSTIGKLSGGERMRLCFATVLAHEPHLLLLDEATNHVDIETLEGMSEALNAFEGSVLMVSHNQAFLSGFCQELWVLEDGNLTVNHSDTASFDEIFAEYRNSLQHSGGGRLQRQRQEKASLAKKANYQRAGVQGSTALL